MREIFQQDHMWRCPLKKNLLVEALEDRAEVGRPPSGHRQSRRADTYGRRVLAGGGDGRRAAGWSWWRRSKTGVSADAGPAGCHRPPLPGREKEREAEREAGMEAPAALPHTQ